MNTGEHPETGLVNLVAALHRHAAGILADTAALDLLDRHGLWLNRHDFHQFIAIHPATDPPGARIDWPAALTAAGHGHLPCTGSQATILHIAAGLGADLPVRLRRLLGNLDHRNIRLVTDAIRHANGTH